MEETDNIVVQSKEEKQFKISRKAAQLSNLIKNILLDLNIYEIIPLNEVDEK